MVGNVENRQRSAFPRSMLWNAASVTESVDVSPQRSSAIVGVRVRSPPLAISGHGAARSLCLTVAGNRHDAACRDFILDVDLHASAVVDARERLGTLMPASLASGRFRRFAPCIQSHLRLYLALGARSGTEVRPHLFAPLTEVNRRRWPQIGGHNLIGSRQRIVPTIGRQRPGTLGQHHDPLNLVHQRLLACGLR